MTLEPTTPSGDEPSHRSSPRGGPGLHPDRDALADYSAEVLTESDAAAVGDHVAACPACCEELAAMDAVRDLLLADDPGPMPDDVWARLSAALDAEAAGLGASAAPEASAAPGADVEADVEPDGGSPAALSPVTGLTVLRRPEPASRRPSRKGFAAGRRLPLLAAAAGFGALLTGLGVLVHELTPDDGPAAAPTAEMVIGAQERSELAAVVHTTGRQYTKASLQRQVTALLGGSADSGAPATPPPPGPSPADAPAAQTPTTTSTTTSTSTSALVGGGEAGSQVLRDPSALSRCLTSLGLATDEVLAVDLATYEGREAALVVSGAPGASTLDVYAVSRNCGVPGSDDGAFTFTRVRR